MAHVLTEQKVLRKLGITDFRHMTKAKIVTFASMLHRMDPAVAQKALDQFPEYTKLASEMVSVYKAVAEKIFEQNTTSMKPFHDACSSIIASLQKQLEDNDLSTEERRIINNQMIEVARMIGEKDTENKHFLTAVAAWVGTGIVALIGGAVVILGGKWLTSKNDRDI